MALAGLLVAVLALIVSGVSVVYTKKQADATKLQAVEASRVSAIEQNRWHADLTPEFRMTCEANEGGHQGTLIVELVGPPALDRLDQVTLRVRDDIPDRKPGQGSQLTQAQISEVIWGPFRINPGLKDTEQNGRSHGPFALMKNEPYQIPVEESIAPSWTSPNWHRQYDGTPLRLEITCSRDGKAPWTLAREITVRYPPSVY